MIPEELRYTAEHEWVKDLGDGTVQVGITDFAQEQLGDIVFVQLPEAGAEFAAGDAFGEVESTKSVSEIYAPFAGVVTAVNDAVVAAPETVNTAPYDDGWLVQMRPAGPEVLEDLLDAEAYQSVTEG